MTARKLFCWYEQVFTRINTQMIGKNLMKHQYQDFYSHLKMEDITDSGYDQAKEICKYL